MNIQVFAKKIQNPTETLFKFLQQISEIESLTELKKHYREWPLWNDRQKTT